MSDPSAPSPSQVAHRRLRIYLEDHLAAAAAGAQLFRRVRDANRGTEFEDDLTRLTREIDEDRGSLLAIADELGVASQRWKDLLAMAGERVGRLKPNDRIVAYSPLSRVIELEGMSAAVRAKWHGWESLLEIHRELGLDRDRIQTLADRAVRQWEELQHLHGRAARVAFVRG